MNEHLKKLKEIRDSMLRQLVELPPMARIVAAESVRLAEFNVAKLGEVIDSMEGVSRGDKK
jgi:hypothetical protein